MTLQKFLYEYYREVACGGNKSAVARDLGVVRTRINSIEAQLDAGGGLGSTMIELLIAYVRKGLDINLVIQLYLKKESWQDIEACQGIQTIADAIERWRDDQRKLLYFNSDIYKVIDRVAGQVQLAYCYDGLCREQNPENCLCHKLADFMTALCDRVEELGSTDGK